MFDRFGELLAVRDHLRLYLEVMDIRFDGKHRFDAEALRGWSHARAVNACRLLNVEEELQDISNRLWPAR